LERLATNKHYSLLQINRKLTLTQRQNKLKCLSLINTISLV